MFENTGLVNCPCCGSLIEVHNNGIMGWTAYVPVSNRYDIENTKNSIMSLRDQWKQEQNDRSNNK